VLGIDADRGSVRRFGFDDPPFGSKHHAEVVVSVGVVLVERNRVPVRRDRLLQLEPILEDDPEIAVPVRPLGLELETSLDQCDGLLTSCLLMGEDAREVQRVGMVGGNFEDPAVDLPRGRPLLGLLQRDRDRQRLVETQRAVVARRLGGPD
jgi:hypothetical protein